MSARGLPLRVLWQMATAKREQVRLTMLPHIGGKFDIERFLRTGVTIERKAYPLPMGSGMAAAIEQAERELEALHARRANG